MTADPNDPTRHWDGQKWMKWNGTAWAPEQVDYPTQIIEPVSAGPPPPKGSKRTAVIAAAVAGILGLIVGGAIGAGGKTSSNATPAVAATVTETTTETATETAAAIPAVTPAPPVSGGLSDQGWTVVQIRVTNSLGEFGGSLRVRNDTGAPVDFPSFTVTVLKHGSQVASLVGISGGTISTGKVTTVDLISTDKIVSGPYTYDFQFNG